MITVRYATNWKGERGYRWTCTDHSKRHKGFHRFDRFTDRVRRAPDRHPWDRAMSAAVCHHHKYHAKHEKAVSLCVE